MGDGLLGTFYSYLVSNGDFQRIILYARNVYRNQCLWLFTKSPWVFTKFPWLFARSPSVADLGRCTGGWCTSLLPTKLVPYTTSRSALLVRIAIRLERMKVMRNGHDLGVAFFLLRLFYVRAPLRFFVDIKFP